ncbi:MAG TPA: hypothetical protein VIM79_13220 [Niastella sp.]
MQAGPDYSHLDSNEKAQQACANKELVKLHLMPLDWGGQDVALNIIYVPEFVVEQKAVIDAMIEDFLTAGLSINYSCQPEYKGKSFIPASLVISYSGDKQDTQTIEIW